jgi:hypothetical protein
VNAVFRCHSKYNELGVWIEGGRTCGVQLCQERVRTWIVKHLECVLLENDLLIGGDVFRENKSVLTGNYQPARNNKDCPQEQFRSLRIEICAAGGLQRDLIDQANADAETELQIC